VGVDKATNNGEIDQPFLTLHARKPALKKQDQEKGKGRTMKDKTNERSTRIEKTKGTRHKRTTYHRKESKTRHHTPSPAPRPTLGSEHLRSTSSLPPKPRPPVTEQTQDRTPSSRRQKTRAHHENPENPSETPKGALPQKNLAGGCGTPEAHAF